MSERVRRPTDDAATDVYDPERQHVLLHKPPPAPGPLTPLFESFEQDVTEVTPIPMPGRAPIEYATPTHIDPAPGDAASLADPLADPLPDPPPDPRSPVELPAPAERKRGLERSEPLRVISMKDHMESARPQNDGVRVPLHVQLRSMAEVAGRNDTPVELGRLAPPRDPRAARARHVRANVIWGCVAVVLACTISLVIWLVAGR